MTDPNNSPIQEYDAVVFGGGMVGAAAALGLAQRHWRVALVEPNPISFDIAKQQPDLRVSAISLGSEQFLQRLGAWQHLCPERLRRYQQLSVWELPSCKTQFDAGQLQLGHLGHLLENNHLVHALNQCIESQSLVHRFKRIDYSAGGGMQDHEGNSISAKLVVAADGANSVLRKLNNISTSGWDYGQKVFAVNIQLEVDSGGHTWQQFFSDGPRAFLPLYGNYAALVWYCSEEQCRAMSALAANELKAEILNKFPALPADYTILDTASFPLRRLHAHQYTKGKLVLAGDAAHVINPLAGQGVNLGFQDVACLLKHLKDKSSKNLPKYLSGYESERKPQNLQMMTAMDTFYAAFSNDLLPLKLLRNVGLKLADHAGIAKNMVLKRALGLT